MGVREVMNPDLLTQVVAANFADRGPFRSALAHVVGNVPDLVCFLPNKTKRGGIEYALGDDYLARMCELDSCKVEVLRRTDISSVEVHLVSDLAVAYMTEAPRGSVSEILRSSTLSITWENGTQWSLGGDYWADQYIGSGGDPELALKFIWALVQALPAGMVSILWEKN